MLKSFPLVIALMLFQTLASPAQNTNSPAPQTRKRTTTTTTATTGKTTGAKRTNASRSTPAAVQPEAADTTNAQEQPPPPGRATQPRARRATAEPKLAARRAQAEPTARGVLAAFESLLDGIRRADVTAVTDAYWNSPQLILFNYNGTITKGWTQLKENRASSYPNLKEVKLDVRDLRVQMIGRDGALVTCLWTQSQVYKGTPETASGRMTIIFRYIGNGWKAIHLHTSPDAPEPSRLPASERTASPTPKPSATP